MANSTNVTAINEEAIDKTVLDLTSYIERVKSTLIRADQTIDDTANFYNSADGKDLRRKYSIFRDNYSVLIENLNSYVEEIKAVKFNFKDMTEGLSREIVKNADNLSSGYDYIRGRGIKS